jgi:hypothetical protein
MNPVSHFVTDMLPAAEQGISLQNCTVPATVGIIVNLILLVGGVVANLMTGNNNQIPFLGTA